MVDFGDIIYIYIFMYSYDIALLLIVFNTNDIVIAMTTTTNNINNTTAIINIVISVATRDFNNYDSYPLLDKLATQQLSNPATQPARAKTFQQSKTNRKWS